MNIILCGLPGSGKTTVGKLVAEKRGFAHIETDRLIEKEGTCREIYLREGEARFRELEREAVEKLVESSPKNSVVSLGGGTLENSHNTLMLKKIGTIVYLHVEVEELFRRICRSGLPAYLDPLSPLASFERLAARRIPLFLNAAAMRICGDGLSPEEMAASIVEGCHAAAT